MPLAMLVPCALWSVAVAPASESGRAIAERTFSRPQGRDARLEMAVTLIDRKARRRTMKLLTLRRTVDGLDQTLIRFTDPSEIRGVGVLVRERGKDLDSERLLFLPAVGEVRRISASRRYESFAGTDFSFADIAGRDIDDYTYALVEGEEALESRGVYVLDVFPKDGKAGYERARWWVDRERLLVLKTEYYRRGDLAKRYVGSDPERIDGVWLLRRLEMEDLRKLHRTVIELTGVRFNLDLDPELLTTKSLQASVR